MIICLSDIARVRSCYAGAIAVMVPLQACSIRRLLLAMRTPTTGSVQCLLCSTFSIYLKDLNINNMVVLCKVTCNCIDNNEKNKYNNNVNKKKEIIMLKKYWKKIGLLILIIACVFNVMSKLVNKLSLDKEMLSSAQYMYEQQQNENKTK